MDFSHFYLSSPFCADIQELARQNRITKQILEAFFQKKLGLTARSHIRPPSIDEILPIPKPVEERTTRESGHEFETDAEQDDDNLQDSLHDFLHDHLHDNLQSVESEQIDSIYSEGMYLTYSHLICFMVVC